MYAFAVVALRLMAIWLAIAGLAILSSGLVTTLSSRGEYSLEPIRWEHFAFTGGMAASYLVVSVLLLLTAPLIARRIAPPETGTVAPDVRSFARLGTFLIGLLTLIEGVIAAVREGLVVLTTEAREWLWLWQGLAHMAIGFAVILLAHYVDKLAPKPATPPGA